MSAWLALAAIGIGTYALRASMFVALGNRQVPAWLERPMSMVGPAAIAALVASMLFTSGGSVAIGSLPTIVATAAAYVVVRRTGNVMHAFAVGMPVLWILSAAGLS